MITLKSNIKFLSKYNAWRQGDWAAGLAGAAAGKYFDMPSYWMPDAAEIDLHLDFAIESLKKIELLKTDIASYVKAASDA